METKICTKCKFEKQLNDFNKNKTRKDGLNNICRVCSNERSKKYYTENTDEHRCNIKIRNKKTIFENRKRMFQYYSNHPCVDCNESDPMVLECDHRGDKLFEISKLVSGGYSWLTIEKEIDKCDVRCANCHRRKTAIDYGWYKEFL
jgi:hypothetical protein